MKAKEAVKNLKVHPSRTHRLNTERNVKTLAAGTGEALPGRSILRIGAEKLVL